MPPKKRKNVQETTREEVKKTKSGDVWKQHGPVLSKNLQPVAFRHDDSTSETNIIYGFDIDDTIITTKSGAKFAKNPSDWKWLFESVPKTLKELADKNATIVFFTNQAGIEKGNSKLEDLCQKFDSIIAQLSLRISVYISTGHSNFRKPSTGMWDLMMTHYQERRAAKLKPVDLSKCFFIGDAAGRVKDWKPGTRKDFSCSDRQFAANIGCQFKTPEEFFLNEPTTTKFEWRSFDPKDAGKTFVTPYNEAYHSDYQELVVLIGMPASGKSTFFKRFFEPHGYVHVNRDTLGTEAKCVNAVTQALVSKKSAVVDNTNPTVQSRLQFIQIGETYSVPTRCFIMKTPPEVCKHLNFVRQNSTGGAIRRIPDVAFNMYKSKFSFPTVSEGFSEISEVEFNPTFDEHSNEKDFFQWTES